jgi:hypothetical protein
MEQVKPVIPPEQKIEMRRTSLLYTLAGTFLMLIMILFHIFDDIVQDSDQKTLKSIQSNFSATLYKSNTFKNLAYIVNYYTSIEFVNCVLCFLYFAVHPFLSYKLTLLSNSAILLHAVFILAFNRTPKPYSAYPGIKTTECFAVFTGPSYDQLMATLFIPYVYVVLEHFNIRHCSVKGVVIVGFFGLLDLVVLGFNIINAEHFVYQCFLGILLAIMIEAVWKFYEPEIDNECLRLGFTIRSSKKHKFLLMVVYLAIMGAVLGISLGTDDSNFMNPDWITNFIVLFFLTIEIVP